MRRRPLQICASLLLSVAPLLAQAPEDDDAAVERALEVLEGSLSEGGGLAVAALVYLPEAGPGVEGAVLEVTVALPAALRGDRVPRFRVTLVADRLDEEPLVVRDEPPPRDLQGVPAWSHVRPLALPEDFVEAAVVVEELDSGLWGAALAEPGDEPPAAVAAALEPAPAPSPEPPPSAADGAAIRLLPPRRAPAVGRTRFQVLAADPDIARVVFKLDGVEVETDDKAPFAAVLDLGQDPVPHTVEAVAYSARDRVLGRHTLAVNADPRPFRVAIAGVSGDPARGEALVTAEVSVPPGAALDRVEFYWNEVLGARLSEPPFRARLTHPAPGAQDFVRVVAYLADGASNEDARLFAEAAQAERVEVNLVELYVVVTDRSGAPVADLGREDFTILRQGRPVPVERFGLAAEVPLTLGVVIDTSESMWPLMPDTKMAGASFLAATLTEGDRAFLVDFDTRPRLAHALSDDLGSLLRSFGGLRADGFTALYDAVIFSLLQLEESTGRKALVLLTDGDDYRSRFGQGRCIEYGRELAVPVYIVGLAGVQDPRRGLRKIDLEGITEGTGGRIFYIRDIAELPDVYAQINAELRSQYLLTFTTERPLAQDELRSIGVRVAGKGLTARTVVSAAR